LTHPHFSSAHNQVSGKSERSFGAGGACAGALLDANDANTGAGAGAGAAAAIGAPISFIISGRAPPTDPNDSKATVKQ